MTPGFSNYFRPILVVWVVAAFVVQGSNGQQAFRTAPTDTSVNKGDSVELKCEVDNLGGVLQWTKDGFALGTDRSVPGFRRYTIIGLESMGQFNLLISSAQLEDDAVFECQVGPAEGHQRMKATAKLSVIIPPESPVIEGYTPGGEVRVPHLQESLSLTCMSNNGKPAATIKWFRETVEITEGVVATAEVLASKLENSKSVLTFKPLKEDNQATFRCEATNEALVQPLATSVMLSVLHPPEKPEIKGYRTGEVKKTKDTVELICTAIGGNPLAKVYWYRNNEQLDFSYAIKDDRAVNTLNFTVTPKDHGAVYRCDVSNLVTPVPLSTEVKLTVHFAPESVTITGHERARAGETITLKCESEISNPAAEISWIKTGRVVPAKRSEVKPSTKGGFVTKSWVEVTLTDQDDEVFYQCVATNNAVSQTAEASVALKVMYPPGQPVIHISDNYYGKMMVAGEVLNMRCDCIGGNPLATLTWWKGDEQIQASTSEVGKIVKSQLSIILQPNDNHAEYRCNATNEATVEPLLATQMLNVSFPPTSLAITMNPKKVKVGQKLLISCKSSSSNPASELSWWKDDEQLPGQKPSRKVSAENGGQSTIAEYDLVPVSTDHEEIYACRATNILLEEAVSDAVTLNVHYAPVFPPGTVDTVDVVEDGHVMVNITAVANPPAVTYSWERNGKKLKLGELKRAKRDVDMLHFLQAGPLLNITNVTRAEAGPYVVTATNSEGTGTHTINVNVQYAAAITEFANVIIAENGNATMVCKIDANPAPETIVTWVRDGYNMSRVQTSYAPGVASLTIADATKDDTGKFECKVNNGIGEAASATAEFVVKFAPIIDKLKLYSKVGADKGTTAQLTCVADGAPDVTFTWSKDDAVLDVSGTKYSVQLDKTGLVRQMSILSVHNTTMADYGLYKCVAVNELGQDETSVNLVATSIPETPTDLKFINATHNAVTISWSPGFNGGLDQTFQVKYIEVVADEEAKVTNYVDVKPPHAHIYTVTGLKLSTEYEMTVRSTNSLGSSEFQKEFVRTRTSAAAPVTARAGADVPLIIILTVCIIGMLLLGLNVLLILFFIRRRRRRLSKAPSETSTSQANSVEMYTAPTITDDSKSRRSMDDFNYDGYRHYDDEDDLKHFLPPPYPHPNDTAVYYSAKPNYYAPPPSSDMDPHYGGNRNPIYMDENMGGRGWDQAQSPNAYSPRDLPPPPPGATEEEMMYADQLRRSQLILAPPRQQQPGRQPPPPPQRSTSNHDDSGYNPEMQPPIPSRNYGAEEIPYYGSSQGFYGPSQSRSPPPPPPPNDPTQQGHLV